MTDNITFVGTLDDVVATTVADTKTLSLAASYFEDPLGTNQKVIGGDGSTAVTGADAGTRYDFRGITSDSGTTSVEFSTGGLINGFTAFSSASTSLKIADGETLRITADQATGRTVESSGTGADDGDIYITGLAAAVAYDFTGVASGSGTEKAEFSNTDVTLDSGASLGTVGLVITNANTATISEAQADGRATEGTGNLIVLAIATDTDLSNVASTGTVTANIASSDDYSANSNLGTVDQFTINGDRDVELSVAMSAKSIILGVRSTVTAKLAADGSDADMSGVALDGDVDTVDLNGENNVILAAHNQANLTITDSSDSNASDNTGITAEVQAGNVDLSGVTLDSSIDEIDLNSQNNVILTAHDQAAMTIVDGDGNKSDNTGITAEVQAGNVDLSGVTLDSSIDEIDLNSQNNVILTAHDQAAMTIVDGDGNKSDNTGITAEVQAGNVDLSGVTLDSSIDQIDLNGQNNVKLNVTQGLMAITDSQGGGNYDVIDSVAALTGDQGDLSGAQTVTVKVATGGTDADMSGVALDGDVDTVDLNGENNVILAAHNQANLTITDSSDSNASDNTGITAEVQAGNVDLSGVTLDSSIDEIDLNSQNNVILTAHDQAAMTIVDGDGNKSDNTGITAEVQAGNVDLSGVTLDSSIDEIDLNSQNNVILTAHDQAAMTIVDGDGNKSDNTGITAEVQAGNVDLSGVTLDSSIDQIDLNSQNNVILTAHDQAAMTIVDGDGNKSDNTGITAEVQAGNVDLSGVTLDSSIDEIDLNSQNNVILTAHDQAAMTIVDGDGNKSDNTGITAEVQAGNVDLSGVTLDSSIDEIDLNSQNNVILTAHDQAAMTIVDGDGNKSDNTGITAEVQAGNVDLSGVTLDSSIDEIDLNSLSVTMTREQHSLISAAGGTETVTLADTGATTGNALVESYVLAAGAGNVFTTNAVGQTVTGGTGDDQITGAGGNDVIIGGDGADTITGGLGEDVLTGGNGADIFVFNSTDSASDIYSDTDFSGGLTDGDKFVGAFDIVRDFETGVDQMDIDNSLTFFNTGYGDNEIYVDAGNVKPAMTDVPLGFALLIRGEFNEANDQFVVNFDTGVDTFVYYDVSGTNSGIVLENSILTSTADFI